MAMADIGEYAFTVILGTLFVVCIVVGITGFAIDYGKDPADFVHPSLNSESLYNDLNETTEVYSATLESVQSDSPASEIGVILLKSIVSAGGVIAKSIILFAKSLLSIVIDIFQIPVIVYGVIATLISIALLLGIWALVRT